MAEQTKPKKVYRIVLSGVGVDKGMPSPMFDQLKEFGARQDESAEQVQGRTVILAGNPDDSSSLGTVRKICRPYGIGIADAVSIDAPPDQA